MPCSTPESSTDHKSTTNIDAEALSQRIEALFQSRKDSSQLPRNREIHKSRKHRRSSQSATIKSLVDALHTAPNPIPAAIKEQTSRPIPEFGPATDFVTLCIEPESPTEKKFIVHKRLIYAYCPTLKAAFESGMLEGRTQTYRFEEVTEETIELFVSWIYTQQLNEKADDATIFNRAWSLTRLWVFADYLQVHPLQNLIIKHLHQESHGSILAPGLFIYAYEKTRFGSPLREFLVSQCSIDPIHVAFMLNRNVFLENYPPEMLLDVVRHQLELLARSNMQWTMQPYETSDFYVEDGGKSV